MSQDAKILLYWVSNSKCNVDESEDQRNYCKQCALTWAPFIIGHGC